MLGKGSSSVADYTATSMSSAREEVHNSGSLFEDEHDKGDRSWGGGSRWPRQETIALLKIRSDMDVAFRDSSLKGPLWDDISRKMEKLGFNRSAKKCKEKFENVYKYHKRTKDGRATKSKSENKSYRFFDQLEALDQLQPNSSSLLPLPPQPQPPPLIAMAPIVSMTTIQMPVVGKNNNTISNINSTNSTTTVPLQTNSTPSFANNSSTTILFSHAPAVGLPIPVARPSTISTVPQSQNAKLQQANLMLNSPSSSTSSDEEFVEVGRNKRKREWKQLFERLMNEVLEKQERLQKKFLEAIERREHDRILREESWKMQEMERMNREREILVKERSTAAAKDAAVISFLQNISEQQNSSQNFHLQPPQLQSQTQSRKSSQSQTQSQKPLHSQLQPQTQKQPQPQQQQQNLAPSAPLLSLPPPPPQIKQIKEIPKLENNGGNVASPSRWPKAEVSALINLRTSLDLKYHENGPKGPLWEDISSGMAKIGYNRSAKRCKEKWENINKYFKKVKESSKRRTEDSKTCPYFHLLDAIYKEKNKFDPSLFPPNYNHQNQMVPIMVQPEQQWPLLPQDLQQQQKTTQDRSIPMEEKNQERDDNDDDEDDDYDDNTDGEDDEGDNGKGGGGNEIVSNKPAN